MIVNAKERRRIIAAKRSMTLSGISPVKMNIPFRRRRPAAKSVICRKGEMLKISNKKMNAAMRSIAPRIFTTTIENDEDKVLNSLIFWGNNGKFRKGV